MADTLTSNIKFTNQTEGGNNNTWGVITDANWERADNKLGDTTDITTTGGDTTLTDEQEIVAAVQVGGTLVANANIIFSGRGGVWVIENNTAGAFTVTAKVSGQTGVTIAQGTATLVFCDGTDIRAGVPTAEVVADTSPQLGGDLDANGFSIQFDDATGIEDDSGNEQIRFQKTPSAVNQIDITNAATGSGPRIDATGDDTNIDLTITGKGTGVVALLSLLRTAAGILSRSTGSVDEIAGERYAADANGATLTLAKSRHATPGSHTVVQDGNTLGSIRMRGSDGAGFEDGALIKAVVDGTPGADDMPTALTISTTADGAATVTERIAIRADGRIQVPNGAAPLITLYPAGHVDLAEVSTPADPSANNARVYVVDEGGQTVAFWRDASANVHPLAAATAAEMEALTANRLVRADRQHRHPGHPKAWGVVQSDGTLLANYGVSAAVKNSTGNYTVTLATAMSSTSYGVVVTHAASSGGQFGTMVHNIVDAGTFDIYCKNLNGNALDAQFAFIVMGDQ
jgi:hypothetical protein